MAVISSKLARLEVTLFSMLSQGKAIMHRCAKVFLQASKQVIAASTIEHQQLLKIWFSGSLLFSSWPSLLSFLVEIPNVVD